jgi:hypothetical protein
MAETSRRVAGRKRSSSAAGVIAASAALMTDFLSVIAVAVRFFSLLCEELREVGEGFELEGVAGRVEEEHGGLFTDLTFEASIGLNDEFDTCGADATGEGFPVGLGEDDAEVGDGDLMAVDRIAV